MSAVSYAVCPVRPTTRALAAMQTTINAAGLALFDGDLDRFGIFSLIFAQTHPSSPIGRPIATYSLATSLDRSFETVRRHVNALVDQGLCVRVDGKIAAAPDCTALPAMARVRDEAHDAFVRFVLNLNRIGLVPPLPAAVRPYDPMVGVAAAVDILLTASASNRDLHDDWLSITIFSTVALGDALHYDRQASCGGVAFGAAHAVRASVIARVLNLPHSTVRRRVAHLTAPGGPLVRVTRGLLVSQQWLDTDAAAAVSKNTYAGIRLILARAAAQGFPFDDPARVYIHGPPPTPQFA